MSEYLYERFLEDPAVYVAARAFWFKQARDIFPGWKQVPQYLAERFEDGELFFDGNPIFNTFDRHKKKAIRIVQESPSDFGDFYVSFSGEIEFPLPRSDRPVLLREKVIVLTLTRVSLARAKQEMRSWISG